MNLHAPPSLSDTHWLSHIEWVEIKFNTSVYLLKYFSLVSILLLIIEFFLSFFSLSISKREVLTRFYFFFFSVFLVISPLKRKIWTIWILFPRGFEISTLVVTISVEVFLILRKRIFFFTERDDNFNKNVHTKTNRSTSKQNGTSRQTKRLNDKYTGMNVSRNKKWMTRKQTQTEWHNGHRSVINCEVGRNSEWHMQSWGGRNKERKRFTW